MLSRDQIFLRLPGTAWAKARSYESGGQSARNR
jgi:hypothetical protein